MAGENENNAEKPFDPVAFEAKMTAKYGDPSKVIRQLGAQVYSLRVKNRELKGKAPVDGSVVLTVDEAKDWESYRKLGKPKDIEAVYSERDTFKQEQAETKKVNALTEAAELHGLNAKAFIKLAKSENLEIDSITEEMGSDGKSVKVARVKGADGKPVSVESFIDTHWQEFKPSLKATQEKVTETPTPKRNATERRSVPKPELDDSSEVKPILRF